MLPGVSHNHKNAKASCNVYASNFSYDHKTSFMSNDCNFQCEINNKAVAAQLFERQGW